MVHLDYFTSPTTCQTHTHTCKCTHTFISTPLPQFLHFLILRSRVYIKLHTIISCLYGSLVLFLPQKVWGKPFQDAFCYQWSSPIFFPFCFLRVKFLKDRGRQVKFMMGRTIFPQKFVLVHQKNCCLVFWLMDNLVKEDCRSLSLV